MSNYNKFKTAMEKLGNKVNFATIELNDEGKNSSSFYDKLINLFNQLPNQPETKDCKFTFTKGLIDNKNFFIYLKPETTSCVTNIQKIETFKKSGLKFYPQQNAIGMAGSKEEKKNQEAKDEEVKRQEYLTMFYGETPGLGQLASQTNESLSEDINRIKKLING